MSSEQVITDALGRIDTYAFEQLEAPPSDVHSDTDLLANAWDQAEHIKEQARRTGEAEGHAAGFAAAAAQVQSAVDALRTALAAVEQMRAELIAALEHDAAELALRISEQILAAAVEVQPERVVDVARNALRRVTDRQRVVLVVNPSDLEAMGVAVPALKAELGGIEHCDVQADRRISAGGAILRTEAGEIDATIETGLERAREIVAGVLKGARDDA
ncbi:MAG TPA: FliH/SctL family protein [Solirubrobacteraceae bacterium]|nr:FliH/SctL family protein [Solirubrobacteraceae bacterium]